MRKHTHTYTHTHLQAKGELEKKINGGKGGFTDLADWSAQLVKLNADIELKELRWLELAELVNA